MTSLREDHSGEELNDSFTPRPGAMRWLQPLVKTLGSLQEACPGVFGFMNWTPGGMDPYFEIVRAELPLRSTDRILDLGCGRGAFTALFSPSAYLGIDISPGLITFARRRHPKYRYVLMDGANLGLDDGQFDAVFVMGVLHHVDDRRSMAVLREIHRVLKPSGQVLVIEPVPVFSRANVIGRLIKGMDLGRFIRTYDAWHSMVDGVFSIKKCYQSRVGFNDICILRGTR